MTGDLAYLRALQDRELFVSVKKTFIVMMFLTLGLADEFVNAIMDEHGIRNLRP